jgi:alpha-beta hydrolase superfamily lysophospholipase
MEISEWTWKSLDGLDMYARCWAPAGTPKAAIMLVHGHGEHVARYDHVAAALTEKGYAMLGFDLRGHGKSAGPRGYTPSYDALMDDIASFSEQAKQRYAGLPLFLYGHSMGGNLVLNYVLRRKPDLRGVIATGVWLKLAFDIKPAQVTLMKMMNIVAPGFSQHSPVDAEELSHDQAVVKAYQNDPLVHDIISARLFLSIYESGLWAIDHAAEFSLPLLLMHGGADPIISVQGSQEFAQKAGNKVTLKVWDGLYHEIHNELEKAEVFNTMLDWLGKQLSLS